MIGRAGTGLFQDDQRPGQGQRPQNQPHPSLDDAYSPSNTVEQTRRLIEQERVAFIFGSSRAIPILPSANISRQQNLTHVFLAVAADIVGDPEHYRWTIRRNPAISGEVHIYAKYILATKPNAKIGVSLSARRGLQNLRRCHARGPQGRKRSDDCRGSLLRTLRSRRSIPKSSACKGPARIRSSSGRTPKPRRRPFTGPMTWAGPRIGSSSMGLQAYCHCTETGGPGKVKRGNYRRISRIRTTRAGRTIPA